MNKAKIAIASKTAGLMTPPDFKINIRSKN